MTEVVTTGEYGNMEAVRKEKWLKDLEHECAGHDQNHQEAGQKDSDNKTETFVIQEKKGSIEGNRAAALRRRKIKDSETQENVKARIDANRVGALARKEATSKATTVGVRAAINFDGSEGDMRFNEYEEDRHVAHDVDDPGGDGEDYEEDEVR